MKRTEPQRIRQIIDKVIDSSAARSDFLEHRAASLWPEIVGQGINRQTLRRYVSKGVLHVYIASAPMKGELEFFKSKIIESINSALGTEVVTAIVIH